MDTKKPIQMNNQQVISHIEAKAKTRLSPYDKALVGATIRAVDAIRTAKLVEALGPNHIVPSPKKSIFLTWFIPWAIAGLIAGFLTGTAMIISITYLFLNWKA